MPAHHRTLATMVRPRGHISPAHLIVMSEPFMPEACLDQNLNFNNRLAVYDGDIMRGV